MNLNKFFTKTLDVLYPPKCIRCHILVEKQGSLCSNCWKDIQFIQDPQCKICGHPFQYHIEEEFFCSSCIEKQPSYNKARSVFVYNDSSSYLIKSFKYHDDLTNCNLYAKWLANISKDISPDSILIPVPLHPLRLFIRKYNQAALIANSLGSIKKIPVLQDALIRTKYLPSQYKFNTRQRLLNVKGVFNLNKKYIDVLKGKFVVLIDDVITTGATIEECSKVLKKADVSKIFVLTLAKTLKS